MALRSYGPMALYRPYIRLHMSRDTVRGAQRAIPTESPPHLLHERAKRPARMSHTKGVPFIRPLQLQGTAHDQHFFFGRGHFFFFGRGAFPGIVHGGIGWSDTYMEGDG